MNLLAFLSAFVPSFQNIITSNQFRGATPSRRKNTALLLVLGFDHVAGAWV